MAITNSQQARQMYNQGGYADMGIMAPRQNYGLGKLVKKAFRGVKKIAKSPLGKMAIAGAIGFGIPGTGFGGLLGRGSFGGAASGIFGNQGGVSALFNAGKSSLMNRFASPVSKMPGMLTRGMGGTPSANKPSFLSKLNPFGENFDGKTAFLTGSAAALAAPFLAGMGKEEEVEEVGEVMDPAAVTQRAKDFYSGMGSKGIGLDFMPKKKYIDENFYAQQSAADGGRIGYANGMLVDDEEDEIAFARSGAGQRYRPAQTFLNMGGGAGDAQAEQMLMAEFVKYKNKGGDLSFEQFVKAVMQQQEQSQGMEQPMAMAADGGRIGYSEAGVVDPLTKFEIIRLGNMGYDVEGKGEAAFGGLKVLRDILKVNNFADGGMAGMSVPGYGTPAGTNQFGYPSGGVRVNAAEGGIMDTEEASEMIDMGGNEKDYRETGGFVEMGGEERADDVPARLSKNEFVFTADAVRNAGGGDIDRGSEVMQNLMDNLEQGGQVSEESQGMGGGEEMMSEEIIEEPSGAQAMYEQQQALQSRMA